MLLIVLNHFKLFFKWLQYEIAQARVEMCQCPTVHSLWYYDKMYST